MGRIICLHQVLCLLFLFMHFCVISSSLSPQLCPLDQSLALLQFRDTFSINSSDSFRSCDAVSSYTQIDSWKEGTDCCSWDGVTCDRLTGHVIGLDLSDSCLYGKIHSNSSLFLLRHLRKLNLAYNIFFGLISPEFGRFTSLKHLNLSNSWFDGLVPSEISLLSKLVSLDLSSNFDLRIDQHIFKLIVQNLTKIKYLHLDFMNMSLVVPGSFLNLSSSLISLSVTDVELQGNFPDNVFHLPYLREVSLSENVDLNVTFPKSNWSNSLRSLVLYSTSFSAELPDSIGNLKSLKKLDLYNCNLTKSIPASLGNLTQITSMDLSCNNFIGRIPSSLSNLVQLTFLDLSHNNFLGQILDFFGNFSKITDLRLSTNNFSGQLPSSLFNLKQLYNLDLSANKLEGSLPYQVSGLPNLTSLLLFGNLLSDKIPSWLFTLPSLQILDLSNNKLTGPIDHFQQPNALEILHLGNNEINGSIPSSIFYLLNLTILDLSSSKLSGEIPSLICGLSLLAYLDLSNNSLSGMLPKCLGNFSCNLSLLNLGMNSFHGSIPGTFAEGNRLRNLGLNGNQLEGPLPRSLVHCSALEVLDLGNNKINDTFPCWLESLPELQVLILRSNRFHGHIGNSKSRFSFTKLRIIDVSHNEFTGLLATRLFENLQAMMNADEQKVEEKYMGDSYYDDSVIVTMKGLDFNLARILTIFTTIDLSRNRFQGQIPEVIGKFKSLLVLNLSHNSLTGYIPSSLGNITALESFDLSWNKLVGKIPVKLTSLTFLEVLNLSHNQLVGPIPRGKQFDTFENDSYGGNSGLCGLPLSETCSNGEALQPPPSVPHEDKDSGSGFDWKITMMGYGCGLLFGLSMGYIVFSTGKPQWFVRLVEGDRHKKMRRTTQRRQGRRN